MESTAPHAPAASSANLTRALWRVALVLVVVILVRFVYLLRSDPQAAGFARVDTSRARLVSGATWVDPRWEDELRARLGSLGPLASEEPAELERALCAVQGLSFVAEVADPQVLWPDGLRLDVRLRTPVACIAIGGAYQPVAADGYLLSGRWTAPPERGKGYLPVIVAGVDVERLHAGPVLWPDAAVDALAVAESMWEHLEPPSLAALGRAVIDAREARTATVENGGVELTLERGRRVVFGRAPNTDEPGELAVADKWDSLERALRYLEPIDDSGTPLYDWELVDVRWDRAEVLPRGGFSEDERGGERARLGAVTPRD